MPGTRTAIHIGLGGTDEVGASSHLYLLGEARLLIDAGLRPGMLGDAALPELELLRQHPPTDMVLTHAHLDHVGALPIVARRFPGLKVHATPLTIAMAGAVMRDTFRINQQQGYGLFSARDIERALEALTPRPYDQPFELGPAGERFEVTLRSAGHLPGAAQVEVSWGDARILHAGDVSNIGTHLTDPAWLPPPGEGSWDAVTSESTYGDTVLPARRAQVSELVSKVRSVISQGGRVLIPTFALGRAQEILRILLTAQETGQLPQFDIVLDGLTREVTRIVDGNLAELPRAIRNAAQTTRRSPLLEPARGRVILVEDRREREELIKNPTPKLVLASSGMLHAGASPAYARAWLPNPGDGLMVVGYQDAESPGRRLLELGQGDHISLPGEDGEAVDVEVAARVQRFHLSAHADRVGLSALIGRRSPQKVLLVHGEQHARASLAKTLGGRFDVTLPAKLEEVELSDSGRRRRSFLNPRAAMQHARAESEGTLGGELPLPRKLQGPVRERHARVEAQLLPHPEGLLLKFPAGDLGRLRDLLPEGFESSAGIPVRFEATRMSTTRIKIAERGPEAARALNQGDDQQGDAQQDEGASSA